MSLPLKSRNAPNGVGPYEWETTESIIVVPEPLCTELIRIPNSGFYLVPPNVLAEEEPPEPEKPRRGRPRNPIDADYPGGELGKALDLVKNGPNSSTIQ